MKVGITGGIGSGKSTLASWLRDKGFPVYNSDVRAKALMTEHVVLRAGIIDLLGDDAFEESGDLNRGHIASKVFVNPELLDQLNELVHPIVADDFQSWIAAQESKIVFKEAAILIESGAYKDLDVLIVVECELEERIRRVMQRDGVTREQVEQRIENQLTDEQRAEFAHYILDNSRDDIEEEAHKMMEFLFDV